MVLSFERTTAVMVIVLAFIGVGLVSLGSPGVASADEGPAILYSYEKLKVGNDVQYVLVPKQGKMKLNTAASLSPAVVNGVFNELKGRKRATYGGTTLEVSTGSLKKGQATVKIDGAKAKYFVIIAAEVVHTLSTLGITSVSFPGQAKKPLKPSDIEFGVYQLTMPAWRALPPLRISPAQIVMPDNSAMDADAFYSAVKKKDPLISKMMDAYFKSDDKNVLLTTVRAMPVMKLTDWESQVLPLLKHKLPPVRISALEVLKGVEREEVLSAIADTMDKDKDDTVKGKAAEVLGVSKTKKYTVYALYYQMRGVDEAAAIKAVKEVASLKEPTAIAELVKTAEAKRDKVALAAIEALGALNAVAELSKLFGNGKLDIARRRAAASAVIDLKDADARFKALTFQAGEGSVEGAKAALDALVKIKDPDPRKLIEKALTHKESAVRQHAAKSLAVIKDPASLKPMAAAASAHKEDESAIQTEAARIMGSLSLNDVLGYTTNRNIVLQRVAYEALGQKAKGGGNKRVFDVVSKGVGSKDAGIRAASAKTLVEFKDDKALKKLLSLGDDKDPIVREFVAKGLANWPAGQVNGRELLIKYIDDSEPKVAAAAVKTLQARKESEAYPRILKLYKGESPHKDGRVRGAALEALTVLATDKEVPRVISVLSGGIYDKDENVKLLAIDLLGKYDNAAAVTGLASLINDPVEKYRLLSLAALGKTRSADAVELIESVINDPSKTVRLAAIEALGVNGKPAAGDALKKQMKKEKDLEVLKAAQKALKKIK